MLAEGYAPTQIKEMLHTTYFRIRRYATGDPFNLCRFQGDRVSEANQYRDDIVKLLMQNVSLKHMLEQISALGYQGKRRAFEDYCHKLIAELGIPYIPKRNTIGVSINPNLEKPAQHYVPKKDFMRHLWSGKELEQADIDYIFNKYPNVLEIQQCIVAFRKIFEEKSVSLLQCFIEQYGESHSAPIKSFASGLRGDLDAVKNAVTSDLSNGFVERNNNKFPPPQSGGVLGYGMPPKGSGFKRQTPQGAGYLPGENKSKAIKRMMYGRAKIDLLRVKVLFAR